jgi:threonine dehydratase
LTPPRLTLEDVERARRRLRPFLPPTPLRPSFALRRHGQALLKLECWQPTGSFKVRGAVALLAALTPEERARGVAAASAGNHALGVAHAVQALGGGIPATVFIPESAPAAKREKLAAYPVVVRVGGATYDDAHAAALAFVKETGATYVHAFDDPRTSAGQGTAALEVIEKSPEVGTLVVPVGGGGLIAGLAAAAKALVPDVRVVAVQPEASPALRASLEQGRALLEFPAGPTLCDGLAGGIGEMVFAHRDLIDDVVTVSEDETEDAMAALLGDDQVVAEGSGAVGVAAVRAGKVAAREGRPTVVIVTGGNVDARVLARLLSARA